MKKLEDDVLGNHIHQSETTLERLTEDDLRENTTERYLIEPFLKSVLNWPIETVSDWVVIDEYRVQVGSKRDTDKAKVDYALLDSDNKPVCMVESKRVRNTLTETDKNQLRTYMKQEEVLWGILTNGLKYCFFIRDDEDTIKEFEVETVQYDELNRINNLLTLYVLDNLRAGDSKVKRSAILDWHKQQRKIQEGEIREKLEEDLKPTTLNQEQAIENLLEEFQDTEVNDIPLAFDDVEDKKEAKSNRSTSTQYITDLVQENTDINFVGGIVKFDENSKLKEQLVEFIELLLSEELITESELPYKLRSNHKRYLLNTNNVHSNGNKMKRPVEVNSGIYLETNHNQKTCQSIIQYMCSEFRELDSVITDDIYREDLPGEDSASIAVHSCSKESVDAILKPYSLYGSVNDTDEDIDYIALYVDGAVRFVGKIANKIGTKEFEEIYSEDYSNEDWYKSDGFFFEFSKIYRLQNEIELTKEGREDNSINSNLSHRNFVTMKDLRNSSTIKELFNIE